MTTWTHETLICAVFTTLVTSASRIMSREQPKLYCPSLNLETQTKFRPTKALNTTIAVIHRMLGRYFFSDISNHI